MERKTARWAPLALLVMIAAGVAATNRQTAPTIALVNLEAIMQQTPGYEEALETFKQEFQPFEDELDELVGRRDSLIQEYERQQVVLSPTALTEKATVIRDLEAQLQQRASDLQDRSTARERELVAPLEQRVQAVIEGIRAERNLLIVFDMQTTQGIVAADQSLDLTPIVVQRLQSSPQ